MPETGATHAGGDGRAASAGEYPRVLFITPCAFNGVTGGGVTFSNLFRGWPKDRLTCVTSDTVPVSFDVCERYFMLGRAERRRGWPWSIVAPVRADGGELKRETYNAGVPQREPRELGAEERPGQDESLPRSGRGPRRGTPDTHEASDIPRKTPLIASAIKRLLGTAGPPEKGVLSDRLRRWIDAFQPEVIYTILGDNVMIDLVEQAADIFNLPVVLHCMDDGVTEPTRTGLYGSRFNARYRAGFRRLVERAADRLAICDAMASAYAQRYAQPFASFHNAVDFQAIDKRHQRADTLRNDPPRLLYAGSIYPIAQDRSLLDCCAAVARLNAAGTPVELHVHAARSLFGHYAPRVEQHTGCTFHDALDDDPAFFEAITSADVLLLPANFDDASVRYIGLSMPTKVPAYLASGTPVLVYGPRGVAQVADAIGTGWGLVVDRQTPSASDDLGALDEAMRRLLEDGTLREQLAMEQAVLAAEHHDAPVVRERFRATLRRATPTHADRP